MSRRIEVDLSRLADLATKYSSYKIAEMLNVSPTYIQCRLRELRSGILTVEPRRPASAVPVNHATGDIMLDGYDRDQDEDEDERDSGPTTVQEAFEYFNNYIGYDGVPPPTCTRHSVNQGFRKILLMNDLHAPMHDMEAIAQIVRQHAFDTDLLLIGGDFLDLFSVSRYDKFEQHFDLCEELRIGKALMNYLATQFRHIEVLPGNHDERWKKHLVTKRGMPPNEMKALNMIASMYSGQRDVQMDSPMRALVHDLRNVRMAEPVSKDYARFSFFMQVGDLIVSHAEKFSRITNQAANQANHWFRMKAMPMGLVKDFRIIAQCHTHQAGMTWADGGVWTFECGCLCKTPDYASNPKLMGAQRPSCLGYSVFYQDLNGRTDMSRSRFVPIEG